MNNQNQYELYCEICRDLGIPFPYEVAGLGGFYCVRWIVTAAMASLILEKYHIDNNRNLRSSRINEIASDLSSGAWTPSHESLGFNWNGKLFDGQTRLNAIVETGIAAELLIVFGVDPEAMVNVNTGSRRSVGDAAKIQGLRVTQDDAAIARIVAYGPGALRLTTTKALEAVAEHRDALDFVRDQFPTHITRVTIAPVLAVIASAFYFEDHELLSEFCGVLRDAMTSTSRDRSGAIRLRDYLMRSGGSSGADERSRTHRYTEYALSAFLADRKVTRLQQSGERIYVAPKRSLSVA